MIRVAVAGAAGRMGQTVCAAVEGADDMELTGRADPELGVSVADVLGDADVLVDFTRPDTALENIRLAVGAGVHAVVGTTGFDIGEIAAMPGDGKVLVAPNFAIGAVLMMRFATEASRIMAKAEIIELHHDRKLDAPSGTAARTAELMAEASRHMAKAEIIELHHDQKLDAPSGTAARTAGLMQGDVPIHSVRLPGLVAHQEVILGDVGQTLTIRHDSTDRTSFMPGVLLAVRRVGSLTESPVVGLEHLLFE